MLKIKKYAAIDIGSNAVRLLITSIIEQEGEAVIFKKNALVSHHIRNHIFVLMLHLDLV